LRAALRTASAAPLTAPLTAPVTQPADLNALLHHAEQLAAIALELTNQPHVTTAAQHDTATLIANLIGHTRANAVTAHLTAPPRNPHDHPTIQALHTALLTNPGPTRLLLPAGEYDDLTRQTLKRLADQGAEIRTCAHNLPSMTLVDGSVAVISLRGAIGTPQPLVVQDARVTQAFQGLYTALWHQATPYRHDDGPHAGEDGSGSCAQDGIAALRNDETALRILQLLATGVTDDTASRQFGCSTRTYRRHVAALMQRLGATSRFQAGIHAARLGLIPEPNA
jgi:DNA-binding CsgD family transcriptional regulator